MKNILILTTVMFSAIKLIGFMKPSPPPVVEEDEEKEYVPKKRISKVSSNSARYPSGKRADPFQFPSANQPSGQSSSGEFLPPPYSENDSPSETSEPSRSSGYSPMSYPETSFARNFPNNQPSTSPSFRPAPDVSKTTNSSMISGMLMNSPSAGISGTTSPTPSTPTSGSSVTSTPSPNASTCSASLDSGTYNSPSPVTITCTGSSSIKYCLQQGSCCDPVSNGLSYSTPVTIGATVGSYCLRFYGGTSSVVEKNYVFNPDAPSLTVTFPKVVYQTTQLTGISAITSAVFGNAEYKMSQVNTQNINPTSLPQTCSEFVADYSTLVPSTVVMLTETNMSSFTSGGVFNVFLRVPNLSYGNNHLTSYAVHVNYVEKAACSTTNVVLQDFDYFTQESIHGDSGSTTVREFSGGFSSVGYFDPGITAVPVNRAPAGSNLESSTNQELRSGLFGVFF